MRFHDTTLACRSPSRPPMPAPPAGARPLGSDRDRRQPGDRRSALRAAVALCRERRRLEPVARRRRRPGLAAHRAVVRRGEQPVRCAQAAPTSTRAPRSAVSPRSKSAGCCGSRARRAGRPSSTSWRPRSAFYLPALAGRLAARRLHRRRSSSMIAGINIRGIRQSSLVLNVLTVGKLLPLVAFIVVGIFFIDPALLVPQQHAVARAAVGDRPAADLRVRRLRGHSRSGRRSARSQAGRAVCPDHDDRRSSRS